MCWNKLHRESDRQREKDTSLKAHMRETERDREHTYL